MAWKGKVMSKKVLTKKERIREMTLLAMFIAIIALLGLVPAPWGTTVGFYRIPGTTIEATIIHIPVLVGAAIYGRKFGIWLGTAFGVISMIAAFIYSPYFFIYPWVSILPRFAFGILIPVIVNLFLKLIKNKYVSLVVSFFILTWIHAIFTLSMLFTVFPWVLELPYSWDTFVYYATVWLPTLAGFPWITLIEAVFAGVAGAVIVMSLARTYNFEKFLDKKGENSESSS